jgi:hypothetical protein
MAMLLVVASTEATDPTRVSVPFRTTANVVKTSVMRLHDETRWVAKEVGAGEIVDDVAEENPARLTHWNLGSVSLSEGGKE